MPKMSQKRSVQEIIVDLFNTLPNGRIPKGERLNFYCDLAQTIKDEGYERSDVLLSNKRYIEEHSVNLEYKNKSALKSWREMAKLDLEKALAMVFKINISKFKPDEETIEIAKKYDITYKGNHETILEQETSPDFEYFLNEGLKHVRK